MPARILIVEDDVVVAETLEVYLQQAGYEVTLVRDGRAGARPRRSRRLALVDARLMIPGMPGLEVCRAACAAGRACRC